MNSITENYQAVNSRVCVKCGEPFLPWEAGCMDRDCPIGADNIEWRRADEAYHQCEDERAAARYAEHRDGADAEFIACMGW